MMSAHVLQRHATNRGRTEVGAVVPAGLEGLHGDGSGVPAASGNAACTASHVAASSAVPMMAVGHILLVIPCTTAQKTHSV